MSGRVRIGIGGRFMLEYAFQDMLHVNKLLQPHQEVYELAHAHKLRVDNPFYQQTNHETWVGNHVL